MEGDKCHWLSINKLCSDGAGEKEGGWKQIVPWGAEGWNWPSMLVMPLPEGMEIIPSCSVKLLRAGLT